MRTVVAVPAEQLVFVLVPASRPRPRRGRQCSPVRSWARAERVAYESLVRARESGDAGLIERARRVHAESLRRRP